MLQSPLGADLQFHISSVHAIVPVMYTSNRSPDRVYLDQFHLPDCRSRRRICLDRGGGRLNVQQGSSSESIELLFGSIKIRELRILF